MLGVGEKFPNYSVMATVSTDKNLEKAFKTITSEDYAGKWKIYFFWPKDFTFVCPTEIAAFGKMNKEFLDRDAQILGGSIDSEFVHHAWRNNHADLKDLPFPMLATSSGSSPSSSEFWIRPRALHSAPHSSWIRRTSFASSM